MIQGIEQGRTGPLYFLHGEEKFLHTEIIRALIGKFITEDNRDFNLESFDAKSSPVGDWIASAKTLSFFGGIKLVVVRGLHEASLPPEEVEQLLEYTAHPLEETCLVMTADKADRKKKLFKSLTQQPWAVACEAPRERELIPWIQKRAQSMGYNLSPGAARMMIGRVGAKPGILATELDKLLTYAGENRSVTESEVAGVVGEIKIENAFALTEAVKEKNPQKALRLLHHLLDHGEDPIKIMGTLAWQLRVIWEVKHYRGKNLPLPQIAREMGAKPFVVEKAMKHTGTFSQKELRKSFDNLAQADRDLKGSGKDPQGILESLLLNLCSGKNQRREIRCP